MNGPTSPRRTMGRVGVRVSAVVGCVLIAVACMGWWLDSRVIDDDGFGDVVAKASQRQEVRDYIADQATLRLARTSNFVSAARPVVTDALSSAIATRPVEDAIREFAVRAHEQVFRARAAQRVDIDAQQASTTIRSALQSINPALSKKLPANVLDASATISQNRIVDVLFRMSDWIWLWVPVGALGIALLVHALRRARDPVHAIRSVGVILAVSGALLAGFGSATPTIGAVVAPGDPERGAAIGTFVETLTGRLTGAGLALIVLGLAIALAPGRDGGDLPARWRRLAEWRTARRSSPRWRFAGGAALVVVGMAFLTSPGPTAVTLVELLALIGIYAGVVVCLRASGVLVTDHSLRRLRARWLVMVGATMLVAAVGSASLTVAVAAATKHEPRANPGRQGCNGYFELCAQPLDQVVWPASHNAMSSSAYNFLGAEHTITIPEQLNAGARFLMLDAFYGYDDNGIVRTNLAGGVDRKTLERERGKEAVAALDRMGALTGTADTSGHKQEVYFCHDLCELGAVKAIDVFRDIDAFLDRNLTDVVFLDFEDYVQPKDLREAMIEASMFDRVRRVTPGQMSELTIDDLVKAPKGETENPQRIITMSEKHGGVSAWLPPTYSLFEETPYTFPAVKDFSCAPKRGQTGKSMFLINHWLRPNGPPDPTEAAHVNSKRILLDRFRRCGSARGRLPNVIAVDFTAIGDLYRTVNELNAAVAEMTGVSPAVSKAITRALDSGDITPAQAAEIRGLRRLPRLSPARARRLLGPVGAFVARPAALDEFECHNEIAKDPTQCKNP